MLRLIFLIFRLFMYSVFLSYGILSLVLAPPSTFHSHIFTHTFFDYMMADGIIHHLGLSSSAYFPISLCTSLLSSLYWLVTSHDSWHSSLDAI